MGSHLTANFIEVVAVILFGIGFTDLFLHKNLIKKIIGLNIMDTAGGPFFAGKQGTLWIRRCTCFWR